MPRPFTPKVVTANALREGDVVYLTAGGTWSRRHAEAELLQDEALAASRLALAARRTDEVVGPYLAEARATPQGPEPAHLREAIRSRGPSNDPHGSPETAAR